MCTPVAENDFDFYVRFVKPLIPNLSEPNDRALAAAWVQKLMNQKSGSAETRTNYLKLLLFVLQRKKLIGIFVENPNQIPTKLEEFNDTDLHDLARDLLIAEKDHVKQGTSNEEYRFRNDGPPYAVEHSQDLLEYSAAQDIPNFGVHAYYAISNEPLPNWDRANKAVFAKGALATRSSETRFKVTTSKANFSGTLDEEGRPVVKERQRRNNKIKGILKCLAKCPPKCREIKAGENLYECTRIDYFSKEKYSPDPNDSTLAIPYAVTKSIFFFVSASLLLFGSYCCCIVGQCAKHRRLCTFISGVAFIVSGLIMLLGLIMYISVFKAEVGSKLRPRSQLQPPSFTYHYGFSFLLYVSGFISTQLAGISAVFLFIYRMQHEWRRKHLEDIRRGKVRTPPPSINYVQLDHNMFYPCRRHPQAYINSNSSIHVPINFPSPVHQRRYFFSKEPIQGSPCSLHHNRSQSNSLKDISSSFYDFPPPPTISYQFEELKSFNRDTSRHFPRDITTNTVSTTADINCDDFLPEQYEDYSPSIQHEHEFVTFDLDQPLSIRAQSTVSVNSRNENNGRKDFSSDTLRRTTPV